jgi:hypothetical protein|tara:strand:- start:2720 stop:3451 length:732 start_codon:yes stop_codon:yes gene_type:complete
MIGFHGCSFTWGSGLQLQYFVDELGWTWKKVHSTFSTRTHRYEQFPKVVDDYRKQHHFPNLVANYFNVPYHVSLEGNGGNNYETKYRILNSDSGMGFYANTMDYNIVQTSAPLRGIEDYSNEVDKLKHTTSSDRDYIHYVIKEQLDGIVNKWRQGEINGLMFLCWYPEHASWVKDLEEGDDLLIKIKYNGKFYDNFEEILNIPQCPLKIYGDGHFNKAGNRLLGDAIIQKIKENGSKFKTIQL